MCGIAGLMTRDGRAPEAEVLDKFLSALAHRGPDGSGRHIAGNVAMIQTRLAIIDLTTGDQPLYEPGGAALVANGEIYNYLELREELSGSPFKTASDCETALYVYRQHGLDYARHLRGMYAIAIHDPAEGGRLVLSRDPFGIKPLYYTETEAGFAFASEPAALIDVGFVSPRITENSRDQLLQLQFTCGAKTIYQGINRLLPGETIEVRNGRIVDRRRLPALPEGAPESISEEEALSRLDHAILNSVDIHQRSDVPYGLFLSGGIDSSALLSAMAELNDTPIAAFTAGFSNSGVHDERGHAQKLAKLVGAEHVEIDFREEDFWKTLPAIAKAMDDPAADYAILPTWKLAERAAQDLKVVLCGEGGDELMAGYGRYRSTLRPWWMGGRTIRHRGAFDKVDVLRNDLSGWRDAIRGDEAMAESAGRSPLQTAQAVDCGDWLAHDLLNKLDRCLMAHGVEGRTPFLDPVVAEASFRLPDRMKIQDRRGKWLLRKWLDGRMPEAEAFSRKRGFTVPVSEWISSRGAALGELMARQPAIEEIAHPDKVRKLFQRAEGKREGFAAWTLLFYALWYRGAIERQDTTSATIEEALEAA